MARGDHETSNAQELRPTCSPYVSIAIVVYIQRSKLKSIRRHSLSAQLEGNGGRTVDRGPWRRNGGLSRAKGESTAAGVH